MTLLIYVSLAQIHDNPYQQRSRYNDIPQLADRIQAYRLTYPTTLGLMQVPRGRVLRKNETMPNDEVLLPKNILPFTDKQRTLLQHDSLFVQLAFGHRRLRAFQHLHNIQAEGYESGIMPVHIDLLSDDELLDAVWGENQERHEICAVDEARLLQTKLEMLQRDSKASQRDVAKSWNLSRSTVANRLRLLHLPDEVQQANRDGKLSERQCLALLSVLNFSKAIDADIKWSDKPSYYQPQHPQAYISHAIEKQPTSEEIRKYIEGACRHAGQPLPEKLPDQNVADERVIQPLCKGCPRRHNKYCLHPTCLATKTAYIIEETLKQTSQETELPISDRKEDFPDNVEDINTLRSLYNAGIPGNYVIAWQTGRGYYPWADPKNQSFKNSWNDAFEIGDKSGIALGHRGDLELLLAQAKTNENAPEAVAQTPSKAVIAKWTNRKQQIRGRQTRAIKDALRQSLDLIPLTQLTVLSALITNHKEDLPSPTATVNRLLDQLWKGGVWKQYSYDDSLTEHLAAYKLLERTGLQTSSLPPTQLLTESAILLLADWYKQPGRYNARRLNKAFTDTLAQYTPNLELDEEGREAYEALITTHAQLKQYLDK